MDKTNVFEATCESCGRVFMAASKRYYCTHCDKYYHVCPSCSDKLAKCRFCGIPLKKKVEPQKLKRVRTAV